MPHFYNYYNHAWKLKVDNLAPTTSQGIGVPTPTTDTSSDEEPETYAHMDKSFQPSTYSVTSTSDKILRSQSRSLVAKPTGIGSK